MAYLTDSQQKSLYAWEATWPEWNRQLIKRREVKKIVRHLCQLYAVPLPSKIVILKRGKKGLRQSFRTAYDPNDHSLTFAPQHCNRAVVVHEVAHLIHSTITGDEAHETHGPEFLALYVYLLSRAGLAPRLALFATARAAGLKWKDLDKHNSVRIRKTYAALRKREKIDT